MITFDPKTALVGLIALLNFILGLFVLLRDRTAVVNLTFGAMTFLVGLWSLAAFFFRTVPNLVLADSLGFVLYAVAALLPPSFLVMALAFPPYSLLNRKILLLILAETLSMVVAVLVPHLIIDGMRLDGTERVLIWGGGYFLYAFHQLLLFFAGYLVLIKKFFKASGIERQQVKYIIFGTIIPANLAMTTNLILPWLGIYGFYTWLGQIFMIFLVLFSGYAILKHHLFSIKVIATELTVFATWLLTFARTLASENLSSQLFNGALFGGLLVVGIFLIKSVRNEVEQREKLQKLTLELEKTNEQLKELDKQRAGFLSFASHQVKAPMAVVKGFASLIADGTYGQVSEKVKDVAEKIVESADRMIGLVNDILNLRRIEEGKMEYALETVDIAKLTTDAVEELRGLAERKGLVLTLEIPAHKTLLSLDNQKFRQVIQNLVENAIKYTEAGWVKVKVENDTPDTLMISVADSGMGMSKELIPQLFEQFKRDQTTAKIIQGTGLGLYIAKQILEKHQGKIWAASEGVGRGSTFSVQVPLQPVPEQPANNTQ